LSARVVSLHAHKKHTRAFVQSLATFLPTHSPSKTSSSSQQQQTTNHNKTALYFKTLAPPGSDATQETALSPALSAAIKRAFGGMDGLKANMTEAAMGVFGSGWAWLCVDATGALLVTTTANQDNPLMGTAVSKAPVCTPILGIDVWEHA
jgi:superoxide dismutase